jgi:arginine decarboxylase-like protein
VEDVLAYVDQRTQDLCKELNEKIDEMEVDLQATKTFIDTWTIRAS